MKAPPGTGELGLPRGDLELGPGAVLLGGGALTDAAALLDGLDAVQRVSPFRHMVVRNGRRMSVAMSNAGPVGWVADRSGYRYAPVDPDTGHPWPAMPDAFAVLARQAAERAGYPGFMPDCCLLNRYEPGARMSLHQDRDERDLGAPIVSVSLGLPATFLWGGLSRADRPRRLRLEHGDVVVWGGPSRLAFHGVDVLKTGLHPSTGVVRYNLTFRRAL